MKMARVILFTGQMDAMSRERRERIGPPATEGTVAPPIYYLQVFGQREISEESKEVDFILAGQFVPTREGRW